MGVYVNRFRPRLHLTLQEAAARFNVSQQMLLAGVRRGKLHARRAAHHCWVTPTAVSAFLTQEQGRSHAPWNTRDVTRDFA